MAKSADPLLAVDTNVLVYAHRRDSPFHQVASTRVRELAEGASTWAIPWPCLHEFFAIATHRRVYSPPSTVGQAIGQIEAWLGSPSLQVLGESARHWPTLSTMLTAGQVTGPMVHDARVAAICADHGVREILSQDRDFSRFPGLEVRSLL